MDTLEITKAIQRKAAWLAKNSHKPEAESVRVELKELRLKLELKKQLRSRMSRLLNEEQETVNSITV